MFFFAHTWKRKPSPRRCLRPILEILEDRLAPAALGGPSFSPTDNTLSYGAASFSNQGQPSPSGGGAVQAGQLNANSGITAAVFANNSPVFFNSGTAGFSTTTAGSSPTNPSSNGPGIPSAALAAFVRLPAAVLSTFSPPLLTSLGSLGVPVLPELEEFSPFALIELVPPQTPPPRAVTLFAPSGGGPSPAQEGLPVLEVKPGLGVPGLPPAPGNKVSSNQPPATETPDRQSADEHVSSEEQSQLGDVPPPPVHAPATWDVPHPSGTPANGPGGD